MEIRYEDYSNRKNIFPFVFVKDIYRSEKVVSQEPNWHDNLEIEFCTEGEEKAFVDNKYYDFKCDDSVVINSNEIRHTGTDSKMKYSCIIFDTEFCKNAGINILELKFKNIPDDRNLFEKFLEFKKVTDEKNETQNARLRVLLLQMLIILREKHTVLIGGDNQDCKGKATVKATIEYIREHYSEKLTLDEISNHVYTDKFLLTKIFKKITTQTIFNYINFYRCNVASYLMNKGESASFAASECGFNNMSFFTKTFKKHIGCLPSEYIKRSKQSYSNN